MCRLSTRFLTKLNRLKDREICVAARAISSAKSGKRSNSRRGATGPVRGSLATFVGLDPIFSQGLAKITRTAQRLIYLLPKIPEFLAELPDTEPRNSERPWDQTSPKCERFVRAVLLLFGTGAAVVGCIGAGPASSLVLWASFKSGSVVAALSRASISNRALRVC